MEEYHSALESFREKNKECIEKQLEYGEYAYFFCMHDLKRKERERVLFSVFHVRVGQLTHNSVLVYPLAW